MISEVDHSIVADTLQAAANAAAHEAAHNVPFYALIPFILMLGAIAVLPLVAEHFWEKNKNKLIISLLLAIPTTIWLLAQGMSHELSHSVLYDYVPFIVLLGSLFVITGGIYVDGNMKSKPLVNSTILLIGAILASLMGTTGAAMLLIRPILKTNANRKYKVHTVLFFIAVVANCGGLLTPLGDPPLFMMYLRGAEFFWFTGLFKEWLVANGLIILVYYFYDKYLHNKEEAEHHSQDLGPLKISIKGKQNFILLIGVVLSVAFLNSNYVNLIHENHNWGFIREAVLLILLLLSILFTKKQTRKANNFTWEPIVEVAYLFIGIFVTMVPALEYLKIHANDLGLTAPAAFYYATGLLSGFLDNTPTAVTFYYLELGVIEAHPEYLEAAKAVVAGIPEAIMEAISVAAVLFGAMTYIGNGPNFMVKAIAESEGIKMPDFFSYMIKFSLIILLPIFVIVQLLFISF